MNEAPQTSIMLFSCSCWVGKLFMSFNLRMTSVLWSERDGEKSLGCLLQLDAILYSKCWSNVTTQCKRFFFTFIILIIQTSKYSGCSGWGHKNRGHVSCGQACVNVRERRRSASSLLSVLVCSFLSQHLLYYVSPTDVCWKVMEHQSIFSARYRTKEYFHTQYKVLCFALTETFTYKYAVSV